MSAPLNLWIYSFSYKVSLPPDDGGHGGGFLFDCRCLPNPGREPGFATETGQGGKVKTYLEPIPEVQTFLKTTTDILTLAVGNYLDRGFDNLSIGFGCTGGQHRSVFFAEHLSRYLSEQFGEQVQVKLRHMNLEAKGLLAE